jgi:hypothetical protein
MLKQFHISPLLEKIVEIFPHFHPLQALRGNNSAIYTKLVCFIEFLGPSYLASEQLNPGQITNKARPPAKSGCFASM